MKVFFSLLLVFVTLTVSLISEEPSSAEQYFEARLLIEEDLFGNFFKIQQIAETMGPFEKNFLITDFKKTAVQPMVWNMLLPFGVGSFLYEDNVGGWVMFTGDALALTCIGIGFYNILNYDYYSYDSYGSYSELADVLFIAGGVVYLVNSIYKIVRPISYASRYNRTLKQALIVKKSYKVAFLPTFKFNNNALEPVLSVKISL